MLICRFTIGETDRANLGSSLSKVFDVASFTLQDQQQALIQQDKDSTAILNSRGDLPPEIAAEYEARRKASIV